jgi:RNA ligase (TIGR02306 family)
MKTPQPPVLTQIISIETHPNADALEIAKVLGFQCVVAKGCYKPGQNIVYFEPDTAFTLEVAQQYGIDKYLSNKTDIAGDKVLVIKEVKLRGELSEGLLLPVGELAHAGINPEFFPCFKYQAPSSQTRSENAAAENALFPQYGSLENLRKAPNFFSTEDLVIVTEKVHGTNSRVGFYTDKNGAMVLQAGSRTVNRVRPLEGFETLYWKPFNLQPGLLELLKHAYDHGCNSATVYGEIYGPTIQSYSYGLVNKEIAYRAFTLKYNNQVINPKTALDTFAKFSVEAVPVIYKGPYSYELVQKLAEMPSLCTPPGFNQHLAEGVVVQHGEKIAKYVSTNYLLSKAGKNKTSDV